MARWRGRNLGIVFQFFQLLPMLSLVENIMLPMDFCNTFAQREREERALHLLEQMELVDHAYKLPSAISGGQQQRVAIARALANDPPLILADEPTGNLDSKTAETVFEMFNNLVAEGKTIIIVTHDSGLAKRAERTALIADGEIVNEFVARALPALTHEQLLTATRQLETIKYDAGAMILQEGENDLDNLHGNWPLANRQMAAALKFAGYGTSQSSLSSTRLTGRGGSVSTSLKRSVKNWLSIRFP